MTFTPLKPNKPDSRYVAPKVCRDVPSRSLKFKNAVELAKSINFNQFERYYVIVDGTFIFGDFIEAFLRTYDIKAVKMTISTLSVSPDNICSLSNLMKFGYIENLNVIVSDYFYQNEKSKMIPFFYKECDIDNRFQLAVASVHTKICFFETSNGRKFVFHGSANLRSSSNVEQIMLEESEDLFNFNDEIHDSIIETYKTINKSVRRSKLWQAIKNVQRPKSEQSEVTTITPGEGEVNHSQYKEADKHLEEEQSQTHSFKPERIKIERFKF